MIESVAEKLAIKIKQANEEKTASVAVMKFALIFVINFVIPVIAASIIGVVTGDWAETALAIGVFTLIRMLSGGYHFTTPVPCMLVSITVTTVPPHVVIPDDWSLLLTAVDLTLFALLAPANMRGYNTMPAKYYPLLKAASVLIVASNFLIQSHTAAIVFAIQGVSLLFHNKEVKQS